MECRITKFLKTKEEEGLLRKLTEVCPGGDGKITVDGREYINFSSNDYLGLATHHELISAAQGALLPVVGASASRLMTGSTGFHQTLEEKIAEFKNKPAALVFNSGYQANVGIISALFGKNDCIFSDRLNHASIVDGICLSGAKHFRFRHNDINHLEEFLTQHRKDYENALVVTETVFSMDGDIAPMQDIVRLGREHTCTLMVDEAHATGIFGENGSGILEEKGLTDEVDIVMGTFSKAFGGFGAYAGVSGSMRDFLVNTCRSFIYSTALPPSIISANLAALNLVKTEPYRRKKLLENAHYFREKLKDKGFFVKGESQIIPIIVGENKETLYMSEFLRKNGYWVTPVRPPTVPVGEARLRLSITFDHTREVLDKFINDMSDL